MPGLCFERASPGVGRVVLGLPIGPSRLRFCYTADGPGKPSPARQNYLGPIPSLVG